MWADRTHEEELPTEDRSGSGRREHVLQEYCPARSVLWMRTGGAYQEVLSAAERTTSSGWGTTGT
jgi:hypothetical protein